MFVGRVMLIDRRKPRDAEVVRRRVYEQPVSRHRYLLYYSTSSSVQTSQSAMVKSAEDVIHEFNGELLRSRSTCCWLTLADVVNMTADELEAFLKTEGSESTGWSKGDGSGESVGHESGRKIVDILKRNPSKVSLRRRTTLTFNMTGDELKSRTPASTPKRTKSTCAKSSVIASGIWHRKSISSRIKAPRSWKRASRLGV